MCKYQSSEFNTNEVWETIGGYWRTERLKLKAFLLLLFFTKRVVHFWIVNESDQIRTILSLFTSFTKLPVQRLYDVLKISTLKFHYGFGDYSCEISDILRRKMNVTKDR